MYRRQSRSLQVKSADIEFIWASRFLCGFATFLFISVGCGGSSNRAAVSGRVTLDGQQLQQGVINFFPAGGNKGPTAGAAITAGRYEIPADKGVAIGLNRVSISSVQRTGRKIQSVGQVHEERLEAVPSKYNSQTTLTCDVEAGENERNFDLEGRVPIESIQRRYPGQP